MKDVFSRNIHGEWMGARNGISVSSQDFDEYFSFVALTFDISFLEGIYIAITS